MSNGKKFVIRTPLELHQAAKQKAAAEGLTLSDLIRTWLAMWLNGDLPSPIKQL